MKPIRVFLKERSYDIHVTDSFNNLPNLLTKFQFHKFGIVISHGCILTRFGKQLIAPLKQSGWDIHTITVPESEKSKSLDMAKYLYKQISGISQMRNPVIFAFGGGVVGDLAGFVAATYRRGVEYIQIPTTLLAQVDSSIGGKVGVDLSFGKNLIGAFYQPLLVLDNTTLLKTLPKRQIQSGMSEVIKYGVISDRKLFQFIENNLQDCLNLESNVAQFIVERCCRIKAKVVSKDEKDSTGIRVILNFGHTLGHALEAATGYKKFTHGEAISVGMAFACRLSTNLGVLKQAESNRIVKLLEKVHLPIAVKGVSRRDVMKAMSLDKKFIAGKSRWVLPIMIGKAIVKEELPQKAILSALEHHIFS
jgi:3-dehydroquinate synthase